MEFGRYLVLSTSHVRLSTAERLDAWAGLDRSLRPLAVASTHEGWFVASREIPEPYRRKVPLELLAAMRFARDLGCSYLLFDCDADVIDALPVFPW
ncbi:hypothetical protein LK12_17405 [Novosphingobium malaysiense]|uniref:DUF5983 domain-containing protein n=1 Tax=Novosphingobium malaysiense TaxID=1348853 RepID=A0A0B1ZM58_9SPHN|nr:hypothetical protein LK12_17405 [Novosphingobium malaysiense]